jgi:putative ABC transport system permease protein
VVPEIGALSNQMVVDGNVLKFTVAIALLTTIIFGTAPALQLSRIDLVSVIKSGASGGKSRRLATNALVVGQIALSFILLAGAGLFANSLVRLHRVDLGFDASRLLTVQVSLDGERYRKLMPGDLQRVTPASDAFFESALDAVKATPGVVSATLQGETRSCPFTVLGRPGQSADEVTVTEVDASYLRILKISLLRGRDLNPGDDRRSPWVALVNDSFANRFLGGHALGRELALSFTDTGGRRIGEQQSRQIVGVTGDVKLFGAGRETPPVVYIPHLQHIADFPGGASATHLSKMLIVRTAGEPIRLRPILKDVVKAVDRTQVIDEPVTMEQLMAESLSTWRFAAQMFGLLAVVSLLLAQAGLYALMSYLVTLRKREIAVRIAIGATEGATIAVVVRHAVRLIGPGILVGGLGAAALTQLARSLLYEVQATDVLTFGVCGLVLFLAGIGGCLAPALRAVRTDPSLALRAER